MQIHNFNDHNSLYKSFLAELRDIEIQKDAMRFRKNVERCGEISAYEISKEMHFTIKSVKTVLGAAETNIMSEQPVIVSVLRAGLPLQQGVLNYFDKAENGFISAFRKHSSPFKFDIDISYLACSNLENKTLILCDPMLATGASLHLAYQALLKKGTPKQIHLVSIIASQQGVDYINTHFPNNTKLWVGAIDAHLDEHAYIVPGLGDAGDLAYGKKIDE